MKHSMPTRKSIGKISSFLSTLKRRNNIRSITRSSKKMTNLYPNSKKLGAGEVTARRSCPLPHRKNHRTKEIILG